MDHVDGVLARLSAVPAPSSLSDDPAFVAMLEASAMRGEMLGTARSLVLAVLVAGVMVAVHPRQAPGPGAGILLSTTGGEML